MRRALATIAALCLVASSASTVGATTLPLHKVGAVTRHAHRYLNTQVRMRGYLLARRNNYVLFSDEPRGKISRYDLPVTGPGVAAMKPKQRYIVEGVFVDHGLAASNGNPDHLELSVPPSPVP